MTEKSKTVKVKALQVHTAFGKAYGVGDEYEVDAEYVETLRVQGKAVPASEAPAPAPKTKGHTVEPMKMPTNAKNQYHRRDLRAKK